LQQGPDQNFSPRFSLLTYGNANFTRRAAGHELPNAAISAGRRDADCHIAA
jgi:hypothetical protein